METEIATKLLGTYIKPVLPWGGWGVFLWFVWYVYAHGEKVDFWFAKIEKLLIYLGFRRDKQFIKKDVRSKINIASKKINKEADGLVTKGVDIIWVNQENIESFLLKGKVIIRMRHHENHDDNVVNAISHYVRTGVLHTGKRYLPEKVKEAINLALVKKILSEESENHTSLEHFGIKTLNPSLNSDSEVKKSFSIIQRMEEKGLFTRILLREIRMLGKKLYPSEPSDIVLRETKKFFEFLEPFACHERDGDITDWNFIDRDIQIGIMYVAKREKLNTEGLEPYIKRVKNKFNQGCKKIYLFGRRANNIQAIKELVNVVQAQDKNVKSRIEKYDDIFSGEKLPAVCALVFKD